MCTQLLSNTGSILICSIKYIVYKQDSVSLGFFQESNYQEKYHREMTVYGCILIREGTAIGRSQQAKVSPIVIQTQTRRIRVGTTRLVI